MVGGGEEREYSSTTSKQNTDKRMTGVNEDFLKKREEVRLDGRREVLDTMGFDDGDEDWARRGWEDGGWG